MKLVILLIIIVLGVEFSSLSQKQISTQTHAWVMYTGNHKINSKWGIHSEYQWRRADLFQDWQQSLLRLGIDYYSPNNFQVTLGYGWIRSYQYGDQAIAHDNNEHRIWQQFITKGKIGEIELHHRYRLEQRFIENWEKTSNENYTMVGFLFRQRVRYRLFVTIPLSKKELSDNTLFLGLYDEPFLGFGKGIGKNILDQNRLYGALGWRFNKNCNIQLGYLNQYIVKADGIKAERNHTIQIGFNYNLDLSGKK